MGIVGHCERLEPRLRIYGVSPGLEHLRRPLIVNNTG